MSVIKRVEIPCPECHRRGSVGEENETCSRCGGSGNISARPLGMYKVVLALIILFVLMIVIGHALAKSAKAADSSTLSNPPQLEIIVTTSEPVAVETPQAEENHSEEASCHVSASYPDNIMQWCELITKYANANDIPSDMIAAVMLQESGGDPNIRSQCGAMGLMQIMPNDTTLEEQILCDFDPSVFINRPTSETLTDPEFNIQYGAGMLAELFNKLGDWREALKAYGPQDCGYYYADLVLTIYENYK